MQGYFLLDLRARSLLTRPRAIAAPPLILFSRGSSDRKSGLRLGRVREPRKLTLSNSLPYSPKLLEIIYKYLITLQEQG